MRLANVVSYGLLLIAGLPAVGSAGEAAAVQFTAAKPVWPAGRETEMNLSVGFRAVLTVPDRPPGGAVLRVAAATIYRAWLNGELVGQGPARGPHGYFRVDEWSLAGRLKPGANLLAIEVAGYNVNSYYLLDQPSFLQAEVMAGDKVLAATAAEGGDFVALVLEDRVQKVQRYSFQRPFIEVYRLTPESDRWRRDATAAIGPAKLAAQPEMPLLPRRVPLPDFTPLAPTAQVSEGSVARVALPPKPWKDRSLTAIGPALKGYRENELAEVVSTDMQQLAFHREHELNAAYNPAAAISLAANRYQIVDFGTNYTGFLGACVTCDRPTRLLLAFDEILDAQGDVDFKRLSCVNVVSYQLAPGTYTVESIEPYTLRYLKLICLDGGCRVAHVQLRPWAHPPLLGARFAASDPRLVRLYLAGVQTFRQNATDIFMDCPSRERAGWLCDSFFTARAAADLTGTTLVEHNFIENFLLPRQFAHLPPGMLPMCYPADHNDTVFIPNWALWFVVQLEEYAARSGDRATVAALRPKVLTLFDYFRRFENDDGLLEKLEKWVFVEWSAANKFVQDVNYPTNMLYAGALGAAARLYDLPELTAKAEKIRDTIRRQSFDGQFFVDNAVRKDGRLQTTRNRSEVCQYFAFFFDVARPETHGQLWRILRDEFGPKRQEKKLYPEVQSANSFIGNMLRIELLSRAARGQQILDESIDYLLYMADRTGTLWENTGAYASCNHGFASHIVHTLYRDVLGLYHVDPVHKRLVVRLTDAKLEWCEGTLPTPDGPIELRWQKTGDTIAYELHTPPGYQVSVENFSGKTLRPQP